MSMIYIAGVLAILAAVLLIRTVNFRSKSIPGHAAGVKAGPGQTEAVRKLSEAIRLRTVSNFDPSAIDWNEFKKFHELLERLFPLVHSRLSRKTVNEYSLVYRWDSGQTLNKPVLVTAHMDVVPVQKETEKDWKYGPFSGSEAEGCVWGRGALDTKIHMISALEAAESLLKEGYSPDRDIYLAFGHDEEVGGLGGASGIVEYFKREGIEFDYMIDEGGCIIVGAISGISRPLALVGVCEKGFSNVKLTVSGEGGHSSMPPPHSTLGLLALAITRLERHQCRKRLIRPVEQFLMRVGPGMKFGNRLIMANLWLFRPLFMAVFSGTKTGNAMLRTTTAVTMAEAGIVPNVLPQKASALANFRILPGETGQTLLQHVRKAVKGIPVEIEPLLMDEPSSISPINTAGFAEIERITGQLYPDALVAPYVAMASTDARKYEPVCKNIYRFTPYLIDFSEMSKMHGTNENITCENVNRCVDFFYMLFKK